MAWYTHQIMADYLNRTADHTVVGKAFEDILAEDVVLTYGTQTYCGKAAVMQLFEEISQAIASEFGFRATPVIICDTEDPEFSFTSDNRYTAVAMIYWHHIWLVRAVGVLMGVDGNLPNPKINDI